MIDSMTGYGNAEGHVGGVTYVVEIKAVNNRYFKVRTKLPEQLVFLEESIEKFLQDNLSRGSINYTLKAKNVSAEMLCDINESVLKSYIERLGRVVDTVDVQCPIEVGGLLDLPGVLVPMLPDAEMAGQIKDEVLAVTNQAVVQLKQMRKTEGSALAADLKKNCDQIKQSLDKIHARSRVVVDEYQEKLTKRVGVLLSRAETEIDETILAREVAIFADKSDICEEIARLESHLGQFSTSCASEGQAGKRLDFISQEMLREANTIASKACDIEIIHEVVEIKCRIDRIKEQVQNVE